MARILQSRLPTADMCTMRLSRASRPRDTTAHLRTQWETVRCSPIASLELELKRGKVRIWDTLGDEQTLKGEYKVITGQV